MAPKNFRRKLLWTIDFLSESAYNKNEPEGFVQRHENRFFVNERRMTKVIRRIIFFEEAKEDAAAMNKAREET